MRIKNIAFSGWAMNLTILFFILGIIILTALFFLTLQIKPQAEGYITRHFDSDFLNKAAGYNRISLFLSIAQRLLSWIVMAGTLIIFWKFPFVNKRISIGMAFLLFALFILLLEIILLPLQYYRSFILEHRFGLSNQAFSAWFADILKEKGISLIINSSVLAIIYALLIYMPKNWWIAAAAIFIIFIVAANFIFPVLIDPLFYKFGPIDNKNLENRIIKMAEDADIKIGSILVADASKKTNRINAYFTGMGRTKRIVIYDNLISKNNEDEVLSVIAHEMGHWKYRHIFISIIIGSAGIILFLFVLKLMQLNLGIYPCIKLVVLMFFIFTLISYITMPLQNCISRQFEKQADRTAIELTGNPEVSISIFKKLAVANLSNPGPHPLLKYIIYSHPPIIERIKSAELYLNK